MHAGPDAAGAGVPCEGIRLLIRTRAALLATVCLLPVLTVRDAAAQAPAAAPRLAAPSAPAARVAAGDTIQAIRVVGNQRIESSTIVSYMLVRPGDPMDPERLDRSLKTLFATGLFEDVKIGIDGRTVVVTVKENPIVNRVVFEGNHKLNDSTLTAAVQLRSRGVFTAAAAEEDRQRILDLYAKRGYYAATVTPQIIRLPENRVNVVFEIHDGTATYVSRIAFVGNKAFGEGTLRDVILSREEAWWRFLSSSDSYNPERVKFDQELLRRFYLRHGYADFKVVSATAELAPDKSAFFLTFTLDEGPRYRVGKVAVNPQLPHLDGKSLMKQIEFSAGDWYDGDSVEASAQAIDKAVRAMGYSFVQVTPRVTRDTKKHTIDITFDVGEGPRVFVERLDIVGNTRTEDKVIRREFHIAEGDPYNNEELRHARQRLQDLGYFSSVNMDTVPGSAPDKAVVRTTVQEKATGELTLGGGYSTDAGFLLNAGLRERNLVGTGIDASISGTLAQKQSSAQFSVTDPYFLDRNLVAGFDVFYVDNNNTDISQYSEKRLGFALRAGYAFNDYMRQSWNYQLVNRDVTNIQSTAGLYVQSQAGYSTLSQIGQVLTYDRRDSRVDPHTGYIIRGGTDFAGLGGDAKFIRTRLDGVYYIPLDEWTGSSDWGIAVSAGVGYLFTLSDNQRIIDNFFLGGDSLRGFQTGGVGPHDINSGDSLGGHFLWTQSTELRFPLPVSPDLGLSGRVFADIGALSQVSSEYSPGKYANIYDNPNPRVGIGFGVSWKTPFGLINIDIAAPVVKYNYDQTQVFRFGFGTRF